MEGSGSDPRERERERERESPLLQLRLLQGDAASSKQLAKRLRTVVVGEVDAVRLHRPLVEDQIRVVAGNEVHPQVGVQVCVLVPREAFQLRVPVQTSPGAGLDDACDLRVREAEQKEEHPSSHGFLCVCVWLSVWKPEEETVRHSDASFVAPRLWRLLCGASFVAPPLWRLLCGASFVAPSP